MILTFTRIACGAEYLPLTQIQMNVLSSDKFKAKITLMVSKTSRANICANSKYIDGNTFYKLFE